MALTKIDIIELIAKKNDFKHTEAKDVLEALFQIIKSTLASGGDIIISGFGKFQVNEKKTRKGRNPATGHSMVLDKRRGGTFQHFRKIKGPGQWIKLTLNYMDCRHEQCC